jgi:UPF0755 protein
LRRLRITVFAAVGLFILASAALAIWLRSELGRTYYGADSSEVFLEIPRHANTTQVANLLANFGVLRYRLPFILYLRCTDLGRHIKAGEYRFAEPATPKQIAQRLVQGDITFRSITVPEGLTAHETIELLAKNGFGDPEKMGQLLLRTDWIRDFDPKAQNLEGYLFPETYRFGRKVDPETVIKTMIHQFRLRITKMTALYPIPAGSSLRNIVILASMIEKEVKTPEEGPMVASVLMNRLDRGMPLSCDATIIYALKLAGSYQGRLGKADLAIESPYNSYIHTNLPPGPIANPGETSLRAALTPAHTDYFYYVSRNDGTHQFSKDLVSHQNAVNRFQKSSARQISRKK